MPKTPAEETEALRDAIREAHAAIKDMNAVLREMRKVKDEVAEVAATVFGERMDAAVKAGLDEYRATITAAIEGAEQSVYKRFDAITDVLLGETRAQRRRGEESLTDIAARVAEGRDANGGA